MSTADAGTNIDLKSIFETGFTADPDEDVLKIIEALRDAAATIALQHKNLEDFIEMAPTVNSEVINSARNDILNITRVAKEAWLGAAARNEFLTTRIKMFRKS